LTNRRLSELSVLCAIAILANCALAEAARALRDENAPEAFGIADFSARYSLDADLEGRVYRLRLGSEIFGNLRQSYDRDLAMFNASGDVIPFTFLSGAAWEKASGGGDAAGINIPVPLFLLPGRSLGTAPVNDITIRTGPDGSVVEVRGMDNFTPGRAAGAYLLDLTRIPRSEADYRIELPLDGESETIASVNVYGSESLRNWESRSSWVRLAANEPLVSLKQGEASVSLGVIGIGGNLGDINYLILEIEGRGDIAPDSATLRVTGKPERAEPEPDSATFEGALDSESSAVYDTGGVFPATEAEFLLKSPGMYDAVVSSRVAADEGWRRRANARISLITMPEGEDRSGPVEISRGGGRYWRLQIRGARLTEPPALKLSWRPVDVVFLAQGRPPYAIAAGSDKPAPSLQRRELMAEALERVGADGVLTADLLTGASARMENQPSRATDDADQRNWPQYMLWGALTAVAALLSWMAFSLLRNR
jgi:hypothetical protein